MLPRRFAFYFFCIMLPLFTTAQSRYDILITECLPDPSPALGLPESEFIELKNHSSRDYNLHNWKISNGSSSATIKTDYLLKADSFLILCPAASAAAYGHFGPTLGISGFPSLNNDAGDILLSSDAGLVIHAIHYDNSWYENELKGKGGWSLEMIDLSKPCAGKENWTSSVSNSGGTPGYKNSVDAYYPDEQPPSLVGAIMKDSLDLILLFDEAVDSSSASSLLNYSVSDGIGFPDSAFALSPFFDRVAIRLQNPLSAGKIYLISLQQIGDCSGNEIGLNNSCKTGLPEKVKSGDIIFNEILFNPPAYGFDYLELFNRSSRIINCSELFLAGKNMDGSLKDPVALVKEDRSFFPGEYLVLTENPDWILQNYPMSGKDQILSLSALPSLPDDLGKVVLLNAAGEVLDELDYDHHWHSPLLASESGVSLERIRADLPTSLASNWTSAAATAGYGTPGYKNSESSADSGGARFISVEPKIFSPDMDGYQDFCFIHYHLPAAGFMGSISIYDIYGRMVRKLVNNILWATSGTFRWDGLDDQQNLLSMGHYVIYVELFLPDGTVKKNVSVCVLARRP
ncbi:MAG TPA: lamin tail domain-containing protein [Puia sp.]